MPVITAITADRQPWMAVVRQEDIGKAYNIARNRGMKQIKVTK